MGVPFKYRLLRRIINNEKLYTKIWRVANIFFPLFGWEKRKALPFTEYGIFSWNMQACLIKELDNGCSIYFFIKNKAGVQYRKTGTATAHRVDGPAIIDNNRIGYYINGEHHRESGPANIFYSNGKEWSRYYARNGQTHRIDGPAVIRLNQHISYWYINGKHVTGPLHAWAKEMGIDLDNLSEEDKALILIYWDE